MKWISNIGFDHVMQVDDYATFDKNFVQVDKGYIDEALSFALIDGSKVPFSSLQLWRQKEIDEQKIMTPDLDLSWWKGDGLYYNKKNIFPDTRLHLYIKN